MTPLMSNGEFVKDFEGLNWNWREKRKQRGVLETKVTGGSNQLEMRLEIQESRVLEVHGLGVSFTALGICWQREHVF